MATSVKRKPVAAARAAAATPAAAAAAAAPAVAAADSKSKPKAVVAGTSRAWSTLRPGLRPSIQRVIDTHFGFGAMTPVQAATIPLLMTHKDVSVQAVTGSGKTLSYVIPMLEILCGDRSTSAAPSATSAVRSWAPHQVGAIIISPTRELATQIHSVVAAFTQPPKSANPKHAAGSGDDSDADTAMTPANGAAAAASELHRFQLCALIGGSDQTAVEDHFLSHGGNIVIATPGRLKATFDGKLKDSFDVSSLEVLILDEADRLLDMGFESTITNILRRLPKQRRTGLFSATQTQQVKDLARAGLRNPIQVDVKVQYKQTAGSSASAMATPTAPIATPTSLDNFYLSVRADAKLNTLVRFLLTNRSQKIMVFFLTCACVDYYTKILSELKCFAAPQVADAANANSKSAADGDEDSSSGGSGDDRLVSVVGLHGQMIQKKRTLIFDAFTARTGGGVLCCTDVAARGIDIPDVDWIVQFDPPQDPSFFVHRIGRTARMGKRGRALVFLMPPPAAATASAAGALAGELEYADFLRHQKVPIQPLPTELIFPAATNATAAAAPPALPDVLPEVKQMALDDRDVMEKGQRAYVSFIRAYKEHHCALIFVLARLPFGDIARGMGLLYMPKMPDLKHFNIQFQSASVPPSAIKYKSKQREAQRIENQAANAEKRQKEKAERELAEKERRKKKEKAGPKRRKKSTYKELATEWDELATEARLERRLKEGKISAEEFEAALGERKVLENGKSVSVDGSDDSDAGGGGGGGGGDSDDDGGGDGGDGGADDTDFDSLLVDDGSALGHVAGAVAAAGAKAAVNSKAAASSKSKSKSKSNAKAAAPAPAAAAAKNRKRRRKGDSDSDGDDDDLSNFDAAVAKQIAAQNAAAARNGDGGDEDDNDGDDGDEGDDDGDSAASTSRGQTNVISARTSNGAATANAAAASKSKKKRDKRKLKAKAKAAATTAVSPA